MKISATFLSPSRLAHLTRSGNPDLHMQTPVQPKQISEIQSFEINKWKYSKSLNRIYADFRLEVVIFWFSSLYA